MAKDTKKTKKVKPHPQIAAAHLAPDPANDPTLDRLADGATLKTLSIELGITPQALWKRLRNDPAYYAALQVRHNNRLDQAEADIDASHDSVDVARAKAKWSASAWRAERECPDQWGAQKQTVAVQVNVGRDDSYSKMSDSDRLETAQRIALILNAAEHVTALTRQENTPQVIDSTSSNKKSKE